MLKRRETPLKKTMWVCALLSIAVLSACGGSRATEVGVKSLAAELVFGVPALPESAPPANLDTEPEQPLGITEVGTSRRTTGPPRIPTAVSPTCPEAGPTEFPEQEATTSVSVKPKVGSYMWAIRGEQTTNAGNFRLPEFVTRNISDVKEEPSGAFTFVLTERELVVGSAVVVSTTYRVVPEEGIYLTRIVRKDSRQTRTLAPVPPLLYLPLPVRLGLSFSSVGVSESGAFGEVFRHSGTVTKRHRVDACGKIVDSWFVEATQEFVSSEGQPQERRFDYGIATQFGGPLVFEYVEAPRANPRLKYEARVGQIEPSSLRELQ